MWWWKNSTSPSRFVPDTNSDYGPPDRSCNFQETDKSKKRKATDVDLGNPTKKRALSANQYFTPNPHPEVLGKDVQMKFVDAKGKYKWYDGVIVSYNGSTKKYGIYFPCDKQTVDTHLDDEDLMFIS